MYDDIWWFQFICFPCYNKSYWHATDIYLALLLFGREQIKKVYCGRNIIVSMFYGSEKIRKCYRQWKFYGWERIKNSSQKYQHKQRKKDDTKDEEPLVTDNIVINDLRYFNLFECGDTSWSILMPRVNKRAWKLERINTIQKCVMS